jgi:hypothetical protein
MAAEPLYIRRTGFAVSVAAWNNCPTEVERVTQAETNYYLQLLTSTTGQSGGAPSLPADVLASLGPNSQPIQQQTTNIENLTFDVIIQATQKAAVPVRRVAAASGIPASLSRAKVGRNGNAHRTMPQGRHRSP